MENENSFAELLQSVGYTGSESDSEGNTDVARRSHRILAWIFALLSPAEVGRDAEGDPDTFLTDSARVCNSYCFLFPFR